MTSQAITPEIADWLLEKISKDIERHSSELNGEISMHALGIVDHSPRIDFLRSRIDRLRVIQKQLETVRISTAIGSKL